MNASQPEAETEYSTGARGSGRHRGRRARRTRGPRRDPGSPIPRTARVPRLLAALAALLLAVAEFQPLLRVRTIAAHPHLVRTVPAGPHHGWALLAIAVLVAALGAAAGRIDGRVIAVAIALLGAGALLVVLGVDAPDAHATGIVMIAGAPVEAEAHAGLGLRLETLGAVILLIAAAGTGLAAWAPSGGETRGLPTARDRGLR